MSHPHSDLSIGDVAKRSGISISTLHYYEEIGLVIGQRNNQNQRRYTPIVLRYLAVVKVAQRVGITLDEIKNTLGAYRYGMKMSAEQWDSVSKAWKRTLDERIELLRRLRDELETCIGCGCLSLSDCPLRNPNDELGEQGDGAVLLNRPLKR